MSVPPLAVGRLPRLLSGASLAALLSTPVPAAGPVGGEAYFAEPISGRRVTEYQIELPTARAETRRFAIPQDCTEVMRCVDEGAVYRSTIVDRRLWQKVDSDCRFYSFLYGQPQEILEDYVSGYDFRNARLSDLPIDEGCADAGPGQSPGDCSPGTTDTFGMLRYFPLGEPSHGPMDDHETRACALKDGVFHGQLFVDADGIHCDAGAGKPTLRLIAVDFADINADHFLDAVLRFVPIGPGAPRGPLVLPLTRTEPTGPFQVPQMLPALSPWAGP